MPRMVDFIASQDYIPTTHWHRPDPAKELSHEAREYLGGLDKLMSELNKSNKDIIPKLPVFEVTNVHRYTMTKYIDIFKDWPCLMLPIDMMWMEYNRGSTRNPTHVGAMLMRNDEAINDPHKFGYADDVRERGKYAISLSVYFADGYRAFGPVGMFDVAMDAQGAPLDFKYSHMDIGAIGNPDMTPEELMLTKIAPFYQALAFMHCKNMRFVKEAPEPKVSKKWEKKHGEPLAKWNTLIIDPLRDTLQREKRGSVRTGPSSLHIARGHFAEYGPEFTKPDGSPKGKLFGKYEGRFWVPQHTRGNVDEGVVQHDYQVRGGE